jgi:transaldolase
VDVFTMPTKVAAEAHGSGSISFTNHVETDYEVSLSSGVEPMEVQVEKLWEVPDEVRDFARSCDGDTPHTGDELAERARKMGLADMFPPLSSADHQRIADDGKIPHHAFWKHRIRAGEVAVDTLLNLAGLASFTQDQKQLDDRIAGLIR